MYWHDVLGDALPMYKREGRLAHVRRRHRVWGAGHGALDLGMLFYEKHWAMYEEFLWDHYHTRTGLVREREGSPGHGYERARRDESPPTRPRPVPPGPPAPGPPLASRVCSRAGAASSSCYLVFTGAYLGASGGRLRQHSIYNHYVYLAEGWLHGRLALAGPPPNENDWAKVDVFKLKDGRELRGTYGSHKGGRPIASTRFHGTSITVPETRSSRALRSATSRSRRSRRSSWRRSSRSGPALQRRALHGAVGGGLIPRCCSCCSPTWRRRGFSRRASPTTCGSRRCSASARSTTTAPFSAGVVHGASSPSRLIGFAWAPLDAERPVLAGLCMGLGFATRPTGLLSCRSSCGRPCVSRAAGARCARAGGGARPRRSSPLSASRLPWRPSAPSSPAQLRALRQPLRVRPPLPERAVAGAHPPLRPVQLPLPVTQPRRRARVPAALMARAPFVKISHHGMSLLVTSPELAYTVMPQERNRLTRRSG